MSSQNETFPRLPTTIHLAFEIEEREFQPDLCIIYDPEAGGNTAWMTAREESYVPLPKWR